MKEFHQMRQEFHSHKTHVARLPSIVYSFSNRAMKLCAETALPTDSGQLTRAEDLAKQPQILRPPVSAKQVAQRTSTPRTPENRPSAVATLRRGQEMLLLLLIAVLTAVAAFLLFKFATVVDGITPISSSIQPCSRNIRISLFPFLFSPLLARGDWD